MLGYAEIHNLLEMSTPKQFEQVFVSCEVVQGIIQVGEEAVCTQEFLVLSF